jgi:ketosteroid isomerase-like protein
MDNNAKQVVFNFLTAVKEMDLDTVGMLLHPEVTWSQPGANQLSGTKTSSPEVFEMVGKMFELSDNTLKLTNFSPISLNGDRVACMLNWHATNAAGKELNVNNIDVYSVNNGHIVNVEIFTEDAELEDDFWGK